jgi:hypothetical protein
MLIPPKLTALIEQLNLELRQVELLAMNGLDLSRLVLSRFPDNARIIELFATLTNVLLFIEISKRRIQFTVDTFLSSHATADIIQELGEDLAEMLGRVLENKMLTRRVVDILEGLQ